MRDYADEGIRHFYFMMLQKEEVCVMYVVLHPSTKIIISQFIDATKKGGLGRFLNHSCNPNCYVAKWVVGRKMRMGIFTKRTVKAGEELTFNYNVDRYGYAMSLLEDNWFDGDLTLRFYLLIGTIHKNVSVASQIAWDFLAGRLRRTLVAWTIFTSTVSYGLYSLCASLRLIDVLFVSLCPISARPF